MTKEEELREQERQNMRTLMVNCSNSINLCRQIYTFAAQNNLYNTQVFMDWQDSLNRISVAYPGQVIDIPQNKDPEVNTDNTNNDD